MHAVSDDGDDFHAGKLRLGQLAAIGQRAAMLSVRHARTMMSFNARPSDTSPRSRSANR